MDVRNEDGMWALLLWEREREEKGVEAEMLAEEGRLLGVLVCVDRQQAAWMWPMWFEYFPECVGRREAGREGARAFIRRRAWNFF